MKNVVVIGGSKAVAQYFSNQKENLNITFHDARVKTKPAHRKLASLVDKADSIIIMIDACSHQSMWEARSLAKQNGIPVYYKRGLGVCSFLQGNESAAAAYANPV